MDTSIRRPATQVAQSLQPLTQIELLKILINDNNGKHSSFLEMLKLAHSKFEAKFKKDCREPSEILKATHGDSDLRRVLTGLVKESASRDEASLSLCALLKKCIQALDKDEVLSDLKPQVMIENEMNRIDKELDVLNDEEKQKHESAVKVAIIFLNSNGKNETLKSQITSHTRKLFEDRQHHGFVYTAIQLGVLNLNYLDFARMKLKKIKK